MLCSRLNCIMGTEEILAVFAIAKRFGATWPRRGQRSCQVAAHEAGLQIGAAQIFMDESSIETVARANGIGRSYFGGRASQPLPAALDE